MKNFDELNIVTFKKSSQSKGKSQENSRGVPYDKYFGEMGLTKAQKEERIEFSNKMEDVLLFLFSLIKTMKTYGKIDVEYLTRVFESNYAEIVALYMVPDSYSEIYVKNVVSELIESTFSNIGDGYFLSQDRAMFVSENEANAMMNYKDYLKAVAAGKRHKAWITMADEKVRKTHRAVDKQEIPIEKPFIVGTSLMLFPKDTSMGASPKETINCRCRVEYY